MIGYLASNDLMIVPLPTPEGPIIINDFIIVLNCVGQEMIRSIKKEDDQELVGSI